MASAGNTGARSKSGRGKNSSQMLGKKYQSSGDISSQHYGEHSSSQQKQVPRDSSRREKSEQFRHHSKDDSNGRNFETTALPRGGGHPTQFRGRPSTPANKNKERNYPTKNDENPYPTKSNDSSRSATNPRNKRRRKSKRGSAANRPPEPSEPALLNFSLTPTDTKANSCLDVVSSDESDGVSIVSFDSSSDSSSNESSLEDVCESRFSHVTRGGAPVSNKKGVANLGSQNSERIHSGPGPPDPETKSTTTPNFTSAESFVAVYWDIKNCQVPSNKSAIDIVKKVRDIFYEDRTEADFIVACDVRNFNQTVIRELNEAAVTLIHSDSSSKNAADQKLQSFLTRYQYQYARTNSAVVVISGDSDFANFICDMRYRHHIYISLICSKSARKALQVAAHKRVFFEDFVRDLPERQKENKSEFCLKVSGFQKKYNSKTIQNQLKNILKDLDDPVINVSSGTAEIIFSNGNDLHKAKSFLDEAVICDSIVSVTCTSNTKKSKNQKPDGSKVESFKGKAVWSEDNNLQKSTSSSSMKGNGSGLGNPEASVKKNKPKGNENVIEQTLRNKNDSVDKQIPSESAETASKNAVLKVGVQYRMDDEDFWKTEFTRLFNNSDIITEKCRNNSERIFYITFSSISKAHKAEKKIQKLQKDNPLAPKLIKLEKGNETLSKESDHDEKLNIIQEKIEEKKKVIGAKRKSCLEKFSAKLNALKTNNGDSASTTVTEFPREVQESVSKAINELERMKIVFLRYDSNAVLKLNNLIQSPTNLQQILDDDLKDYGRECRCFEEGLPIYAIKDDLLRSLKKSQVVIVSADSGSGKSTQIPQFLWRNGFGQKGSILCTEPNKLSVISVARHVSKQIGSKLGDIAGYQVGSSCKKTERTQILFVSEFTMLKMCENKEFFEDISCLVIDEAQERTIYTDILLGLIKRALYRRSNLKVIINCTIAEASKFCAYFDLSPGALLQLPSWTYPITDVWLERDSNLEWNFLEKAVNAASNLLNEASGDILVFLPTSLEAEQASVLLMKKLCASNGKVIVFCLHSELDITEQQKVFDSQSKGSRKIVFCDSYAETLLTLPGIKYVVDCGRVEQLNQDALHNLNVLSVGFVSQRSAEQRRRRAGRTLGGKCIRLYSVSDFENHMISDTKPEIFRVNLTRAVLSLMASRVKDPITDFDFIEPPSRDSLITSLNQLIHLGAVDSAKGILTDMGKKMAKLPLEPRLSHLVLRGIEQGIPYESLVIAAALCTVSTKDIFFSRTEGKNVPDMKKGRFRQSRSDFLNFFELFEEWKMLPKAEKTQWCISNNISSRSMKAVLEQITDLQEIIRGELNIEVKSRIAKDPKIPEVIHNIILHSFGGNLCVFSGYYKFGYLSPNMPHELHVHPSSSLLDVRQKEPQYIVYDRIFSGSQKLYLLNVAPISENAVELAIQSGWMTCDLDKLKSLILHPYPIVPVGETILKTFFVGKGGCKLDALEKKLQSFVGNNRCAIEVRLTRGEIVTYLPSGHSRCVKEVVLPIIRNAKKQLLDEEAVLKVSGFPDLFIVLGTGAGIREVILPGERQKIESKSTAGAAVVKAVKGMHESADTWKFFKVLVSFLRRPCTGLANMSFKSPEDCMKVSDNLSDKAIFYNSTRLVFQVSKDQKHVLVRKLPRNATKEKLSQLLKKNLPKDVKIPNIHIETKKEFQSSESDIREIKQEMKTIFSRYTATDYIDVSLMKTKPKNHMWNVWVHFRDSRDGQMAVNALTGSSFMIGGEKQDIELKPLLTDTIFCDLRIFCAVKSEIDEALNSFRKGKSKTDQLLVSAKNANSNSSVTITVTSNNLPDIYNVRSCILGILMGENILHSGNYLEKLFLPEGRAFLKNLESKIPNMCIKLNSNNKTVIVFGSKATRSAAGAEISAYLNNLKAANSVNICLTSDSFRKGLLKELVKLHGYGLGSLKTHCNLQSLVVHPNLHDLSVIGNTSTVRKLEEILTEVSETLQEDMILQEDADIEICPVCFMPIDIKFYRLEYCGHACCQECILFYYRHQKIPLKCPKKDCKAPLVIQDLNWVFQQDPEMNDILLNRALESFLHKHRGKIYCCLTPGCPTMYREGQGDEGQFVCQSCRNNICSKCHVIFHIGMSCELYRLSLNDKNYPLKVWLVADPESRKLCPTCKAPIEKHGNCNHIACWNCKCQICWLCEKVFRTGCDVNNHQSDQSSKCFNRFLAAEVRT